MRKQLITLIILCSALFADAQIFYSSRDSISSLIDKFGASDIAVDDTGRVWVSFDGYRNSNGFFPSSLGLQTIGKDERWSKVDLNSIGGPQTSFVTSLMFYQNALWVGTANGMFEKKGNIWRRVASDSIFKDSVNHFTFKGRNLFLATQKGIKCYYRNNYLSYWKHYHTGNSALPTDHIRSIDMDANGKFWLATAQGVLCFDPIKNQVAHYDSSNSDFSSNLINHVKVLPSGEVWAATSSNVDSSIASFVLASGNIVPGLFLLKQNRFVNMLEAIGLCNMVPYPHASFRRITVYGDHIVFAAFVKNYNMNHYAWYQVNAKGVKRFFLPVPYWDDNNIGQNQYAIRNDSFFFYPFRIGRYVSICFNNLKEDTSYYYSQKSMQLSNDYRYKEVGENIDINQLKGPINVRGDMFWSVSLDNHQLRIKDQQCKPLIASAALWMGGINDGNFHVAAGTFRQAGIDYIQGPLKLNNSSPLDTNVRMRFSRIWKINQSQINEFRKNFQQTSYMIPEPILSWPAHGDSANGYAGRLAPFEDLNGNGRYEPLLGDYPKIKGQQTLYWIFNDSLGFHGESDGLPLGVEVQSHAYGYVCDQIDQQHSDKALNNTIFINYKIINRSTKTYDNFNAGFWLSNYLGNPVNDKVGSNPVHQYAYFYNADTIESGVNGFKDNYPALAVLMLKGLNNEQGVPGNASRMVSYRNDFSVTGFPVRPHHYYNYLQGKWKDGRPITYGQSGRESFDSNDVWMYPGNSDSHGRDSWFDERESNQFPVYPSILLATDNITLSPGEEQEMEIALVYSTSKTKQLSALLKELDADVLKVKSWYINNNFPYCSDIPLNLKDANPAGLRTNLLLYPNPNSGLLHFNADRPLRNVSVFNLQGGLVISLSGNDITELNVNSLPVGLYLFKGETDRGVTYQKFIKE